MDFEEFISKPRNESGSLCYCCLAKQIPVVSLETCQHVGILQSFHKTDFTKWTICITCHRILVKFETFKNKVIENCLVFENLVCRNLLNQAKQIHNLRKTKTISFTLPDESSDLEDINQEPAKQRPPFELITDLKIEHNSDSSEFENDLPLSEVKKIKRARNKTASLDEKYEGKIMVYNLNVEELEEERQRESQKESYLKLPFKCDSCVKGFDHENTLRSHIEKQHNIQKKGGITCDICKTVLGPVSYKEHSKRHFRRFQCMVCGKRSQDVYSVAQHYNMHHADREPISMQFTCSLCDFTTDSNRIYRYHRDKHRQKQQCSICGNTYVSVNSLRVHILHVHNQSPRAYKCVQCDKSYSSKSGFYNHNMSAHGTTRAAYCAPCNTHFATKTGLAHHLRTHSKHLTQQDKKFVCNDCDAKFVSKSALQAHIDWDHLKTIKHECTKCSKVFKLASTLKIHYNYVHERKRPPRDKICDYCGRGFTTHAILRCHIRTHTGARPLRCTHCSATFAHSAALYTHNKLHNKNH